MRFLADMGVSQRVVEWLRETGHEAVHLREEGLQRLPDTEVFAKARALARDDDTVKTAAYRQIAALSDRRPHSRGGASTDRVQAGCVRLTAMRTSRCSMSCGMNCSAGKQPRRWYSGGTMT